MQVMSAPEHNLTVKYLTVQSGGRTSLQRHDRKDELLLILDGSGWVEAGGAYWRGAGELVRIRPGVVHRVTGPLTYLEVSSYDDDTDTVRLGDDYGR
jgi:quercetin dioxygenase-like cupin family protein